MIQLDVSINTEALEEWIEYRNTNFKKAMSELAIKKCTNKLKKYSHDVQQAAVDKAINNDWKDVYPAKVTEDDLRELREERITIEAESKEVSISSKGFIETHTSKDWAKGLQ